MASPAVGVAGASEPTGAEIVTMWNAVTVDTVVVDAGKANPEAFYWFAVEQAAVYNAVVGITRRYELYKWDVRGPRNASPGAAAAAAAHTVLLHSFPASEDRLDDALELSLSSIPDGMAKTKGIEYGEAAAERIIALRAGDSLAPIPYTEPPAPGVWQPTPPTFAPFFGAFLGELEPFMLGSTRWVRPPAPPGLNTKTYTREFEEVKDFGAKTGSLRSDEQTQTALFFSDVGIVGVQAGLRDLIQRREMNISDAARVLAAVDLSIIDTVITVWEAKARYHWWRPIHAIQQADDDGNDATDADPTWEPLIANPPYPEYPSGLNGVVGAAARALRKVVGSVNIRLTSAAAGETRHYRTEVSLKHDAIDSRVWSGIHFRTAEVVAFRMGTRVAGRMLDRYFERA
ncbi:MAG TPA: vanadium-dependent haloperoxidase [Actinomycetota bacterium]|nr:vanadium-dependent haloperoxidase [Actinomycetota bacterium]